MECLEQALATVWADFQLLIACTGLTGNKEIQNSYTAWDGKETEHSCFFFFVAGTEETLLTSEVILSAWLCS